MSFNSLTLCSNIGILTLTFICLVSSRIEIIINKILC
uniref:Uncharacterized protein n=1 Tax=Rhizophora mucronata TaxID=61149 RepID=A0A2P2R1Q9_RHIMU